MQFQFFWGQKKNNIKVVLFFTENIFLGSECSYSSKICQLYHLFSEFHVIFPVTSKLVPVSYRISNFRFPLSILNPSSLSCMEIILNLNPHD